MIDFDIKVYYIDTNRSHRASDSSVPWWAFLLYGGEIVKDPKTIEQQVEILVDKGLIINNSKLNILKYILNSDTI